MVILAAFRRMGIISLEIGSLLIDCPISIDGRLGSFFEFVLLKHNIYFKKEFLFNS